MRLPVELPNVLTKCPLIWKSEWKLTSVTILAVLLAAASVVVSLNRSWEYIPYWGTAPLMDIKLVGGYAYIAPTNHAEVSSHENPSPAQVLEDGRPLPGPANAMHVDIQKIGKGRYSFWHDYVYFSAGDNTDPTQNRRRYSFRYPFKIGDSVAYTLYILTLGVWLTLCRSLVIRGREHLVALARLAIVGSGHLMRQLVLPAAIASLVPLYLLWTLPPTFSGTDAGCYFSWTIKEWTPFYRPGYLFFIRSINNIFAGIPLGGGDPNAVSTTAVYAIVILQHLVAVLGIAYFAATVARSAMGKVAIALSFSLLPVIFLYSHGIFQEALIPGAVLVVGASILRIHQSEDSARWLLLSAVITFSLYSMLMIRIDPVLLLLLPVAPFLFLAASSRNRQDHLRKHVCLLAAGLASILLFALTIFLVNTSLGTSRRPSPFGLRMTYLIAGASVQQEPDAKQRLIGLIKAKLTDADERECVQPIFDSTHAWTEHFARVRETVVTLHPTWDTEAVDNRTNQILNRVAFLFMREGFKYYFWEAWAYFKTHLEARPRKDLAYVIDASLMLLDYQQGKDGGYEVLKGLPLFSHSLTRTRYESLYDGTWAKVCAKAPVYGIWYLIDLALFGVCLCLRKMRTASLWLFGSFLMFALGHTIMMSAAQLPTPRYHNIGITLLAMCTVCLVHHIGTTMFRARRS